MNIKKIIKQIHFLVANRSDIERLLSIRTDLLGADLAVLPSKILLALFIIAVAVLTFFIGLVFLLLGLNELLTTPQARLWLLFGGGVFMMLLLPLLLLVALVLIKSPMKQFTRDYLQMKEDIFLILGQLNTIEVENCLQKTLDVPVSIDKAAANE